MRDERVNISLREWSKVFGILLGIKLIVFLCFFYAHHFIPRAKYPSDIWMVRPGTSLAQNLANFDGAWFIRISALGYQRLTTGDYSLDKETARLKVMDQLGFKDGVERKYAYRHWPLFPWLIKVLAPVLKNNYLIAGIALSNFFYLLYGIFFYKLARIYFREQISQLSLCIALIHPGAYALNAVYNEPVFLFFITACFYFLKKDRFFLAGFFAGLASLTRIESVLIYVPILYEYLRKNSSDNEGLFSVFKPGQLKKSFSRLFREPGVLWLFLGPVGSLVVLLYFKLLSGSAFIFVQVHEANIYGHFGFPWQMLYATYLKGADTYLKELPLHFLLLLVIIFSFRKIDWTLWVWLLSFWIFYTTNGNHSYLRYQVMCVPMFLAMGSLLENRPILQYLYIICSSSAMVFFSAMYINGYWVA